MLKRHQTRAVAYATTCITIIVIFMKLSSYNKAWTKLKSSEHHHEASNSVSETLVREVSGSESDVDLSRGVHLTVSQQLGSVMLKDI